VRTLLVLLDEPVDHFGFRQRGDVAHALVLRRGDLPQDAPHDLAATGFRQARRDVDDVRGCEGADDLPHLLLEGADELLGPLLRVAAVEQDVTIDALALDGMRVAHHSR